MNINRCKQCGNKFPDIKSDTVPVPEMKEFSNTTTYKRVFRIECPCGMKTVDTSSCRMIFGEADFLPGIVIDKFSSLSPRNAGDKVSLFLFTLLGVASVNSYVK